MSVKRTHRARCIGDYVPIRTLGTGATGKVKLARHIKTGDYVALKVIRKQILDRHQTLYQKVKREIAVMKLIGGSCRHIARLSSSDIGALEKNMQPVGVMNLLDVYETDEHFVLILEYCEGGELFDVLIESGYFREETALDYFQQLVYALEFCHNRGVCHRDLKPENVLLTADGHLKLADFGMSGLINPGLLLETSCGSPQYSAPEVISGESYEGCAADIWSLGVVLFAMCTGGLPFHDDNITRLMTKIQSGNFYIPPAVPEHLAELLKSMLVVDPAERATIDDIKKSVWFQSRESRSTIYKDEHCDFGEFLAFQAQHPVETPDPEILRYLADLGLGDIPTIKRRLKLPERCLERDFYYQLQELCADALCYRPVKEVPLSPRSQSAALSPDTVKIAPPKLPLDIAEDQLHRPPLSPSNDAEISSGTVTFQQPHKQSYAMDRSGSVSTEPQEMWFPKWSESPVPRNSPSPVTITAVSAVDSSPLQTQTSPETETSH